MNKNYRLNEARRINRILAEEKQRFLNEVFGEGYEEQPEDMDFKESDEEPKNMVMDNEESDEEPMWFDNNESESNEELSQHEQQGSDNLWELDKLPELAAENPEAEFADDTENHSELNEWSYDRDVLDINPERKQQILESMNQARLISNIKLHWNSNATKFIK